MCVRDCVKEIVCVCVYVNQSTCIPFCPSHIGSSLHNVAYHSQRQIYCYQYLITSIIATSITELQIILLSDLYT